MASAAQPTSANTTSVFGLGASAAVYRPPRPPTPTSILQHQQQHVRPRTPPRRPDTPRPLFVQSGEAQSQHSLHRSASATPTHRRVRRKPSTANLNARSANVAAVWPSHPTLTSPFIRRHDFSQVSSSRPYPSPATPLPLTLTSTGSPSLSSTVSTLQSTTVHTPALRDNSELRDCSVDDETSHYYEPIRTKRKFPDFRAAKRLPRRADGINGSVGTNDAPWEVYAAVFDLAVDNSGIDTVVAPETTHNFVAKSAKQTLCTRLEDESRKGQAVRFKEHESASESTLPSSQATLESGRLGEENQATATSSFSLSKFQFPQPPANDTWAENLDPSCGPDSPQSPATLHLHGTSFDLVNPHASLLLGVQNLETPAEIDGLLDDYFDPPVDDTNMPQPHNTRDEMSTSSFRVRKLYDDASHARRSIMGVVTELSVPPQAHINDSPLAHKSATQDLGDSITTPSTPPEDTTAPSQVTTSPFRKNYQPDDIGDAGIVPKQDSQRRRETSNVSKLVAARSTMFLSSSHTTLETGFLNSRGKKGSSQRSDPFDLSLSERGSNAPLCTVDEVTKPEEHAKTAPRPLTKAGTRSFERNADLPAISADNETDPTIKEILNGYEYTRMPTPPPEPETIDSSPSVERGRGLLQRPMVEKMRNDSIVGPDLSPECENSSTALNDSRPAPATHAIKNPLRAYSARSELRTTELPTSERTYGETNQLLQISHYSPSEAQRSPSNDRDIYGAQQLPSWETIVHDDSAMSLGTRVGNSNNYNRVSFSGRQDRRSPEECVADVLRSTFNEAVEHHLPRRSTVLSFGDDDNEWITQPSDSQPELSTSYTRSDRGSYVQPSIPDSDLQMLPSLIRGPYEKTRCMPGYKPSQDTGDIERQSFEEREVRKALSLLSDRVMTPEIACTVKGSLGPEELERRREDLYELACLHRGKPDVVKRAVGALADSWNGVKANQADKSLREAYNPNENSVHTLKRLQKRNIFRPAYQPTASFAKGAALHTSNSSFADREGLLSTPVNGLEFSPTTNTFQTIKPNDYPIRHGSQVPWSPFDKDATAHALGTSASYLPTPPSTGGTAAQHNDLDSGHDRTAKHQSRAAVQCQKGCIPLKLVHDPKSSRSPRQLTDAEMITSSHKWNMRPDLRVYGPLARYAASTDVCKTGPLAPTLNVRSNDPRSAYLDLHFPDDIQLSHNPVLIHERDRISNLLIWTCILFPPLTFAFQLGYFDAAIRAKTRGMIPTASPHIKRRVPYIYFPLFVVVWVAIAVAIYYGVELGASSGTIGS